MTHLWNWYCLLKYAYLPSKEVVSVSVFSQLEDTLMLLSDCLLSNMSALGLRAAPLRLGVTWISKHNNSLPCHWNQIFCSLALCNFFFISLCNTTPKLHMLYFERQTSNRICFTFCACNLKGLEMLQDQRNFTQQYCHCWQVTLRIR